jgi:uncharacterized membrane protein YjjB (DUF3815 family)
MVTLVYIIWILIPGGMFLLALKDFIDKKSHRKKDRHSLTLMKQALFVFLCVVVSALVDKFLLDVVAESLLLDLVDRDLVLVLLLPFVLVVASMVVGPSKPILIVRGSKKT